MIDGVNVRLMRPEDRAALVRLAALDSAAVCVGAYLVAEVDGELWAAVPLEDGVTVADPFRFTADLVELLEMRAAQMRSADRVGRSLGRAHHRAGGKVAPG